MFSRTSFRNKDLEEVRFSDNSIIGAAKRRLFTFDHMFGHFWTVPTNTSDWIAKSEFGGLSLLGSDVML